MNNYYSIYNFYKLPEESRIKLIGQSIQESRKEHSLYYVFGCNDRCFNYGYKQGLISLHKPLRVYLSKTAQQKLGKRIDLSWFKIGAFSPDDLDMDLEFSETTDSGAVYRKVKRFMDEWAPTFTNTSYREIFTFAQRELKMGRIL